MVKKSTSTPADAVAPKTVVAPKAKVADKVVASKAKAADKVVAPKAAAPTTDNEVDSNEVVVDETLGSGFQELMKKLAEVSNLLNVVKSEARALEKRAAREMKALNKAQNKRKAGKGNRSPSGFVKPTLITDELAAFLGKPNGAEMARTEVTREINTYIRENNLQDKKNGRIINPDAKLATLLKVGKTEELTYFNLQRYMSPHFAKGGILNGVPVPESTTAAPVVTASN